MLNYSWIILLLLNSALSQTTDKYSDEDRPYKFGFNIQGYQHRQEEKDEKGLIKGEYGFITADGYYRVTVYATDENGDFKILSMKNYYVGFPPEDPTTTPGPPSRSSNARQPLSNPSFGTRQGPTGRAFSGGDDNAKPATSTKPFTRPQGLAACSDCSIPTTTVRSNQDFILDKGDLRSGRREGGRFANFGQGLTEGQAPQGSPRGNIRGSFEGQTPQGSPRGNTRGPGSQFSQGTPGGINQGLGQFPQEGPRTNAQRPSGGFGRGNPTGPGTAFGGGSPQGPGAGPRSGTFGSSDPSFPRARDDFRQNNQLGDSPRQRPQIGEVRDGLPPGVTLHDIKDLLYTFNYTVGFHGHHEDGYRNGDKQGDYFFDGRDGVERKVEYLANEFGFQPNITLIDLPENDVRRPNEQTEKEYGLKGYEFKWFYRK